MKTKGVVAPSWWKRFLERRRRIREFREFEARPEVREAFQKIHQVKGYTLDEALDVLRKSPSSPSEPISPST